MVILHEHGSCVLPSVGLTLSMVGGGEYALKVVVLKYSLLEVSFLKGVRTKVAPHTTHASHFQFPLANVLTSEPNNSALGMGWGIIHCNAHPWPLQLKPELCYVVPGT